MSAESKRTGKRGPASRVLEVRSDLGCTVGVDLEATQVRGVVLDFSNEVVDVRRESVLPSSTAEDIVRLVASVTASLCKLAKKRRLAVDAVGLALPAPLVDAASGRVETELQFGKTVLEFVPKVHKMCGVPTVAAVNNDCFALGHHRLHHPRYNGVELVILNRFGIGCALVWNGQIYVGASHLAGDLGLIPCCTVTPPRRFQDVCTGASLLHMARQSGDERPFQEIIKSANDPVVTRWLGESIPAFCQAISIAVIAYNPNRIVIEGIFNHLTDDIRSRIMTTVQNELLQLGLMIPEMHFYEGDDLMGARGVAILARGHIADKSLAAIVGDRM